MGQYVAKLIKFLNNVGTTRVCFILLGIDNAGKTALLYRLKINNAIVPISTIGFNREDVRMKDLRIKVWDVGGLASIRNLWKHYLPGADGVIFVVDSTDRDRLSDASIELHRAMAMEVRGIPLLVLANKQDLEGAMTPKEVKTGLRLSEIRDRLWSVRPCSVVSKKGITEGFLRLATLVRDSRRMDFG